MPPSCSCASYFVSNSALMDTSFAQKIPWCLSSRQHWFCSLHSPACPGPSQPRGHCPPIMTRCSLALEVCASWEQVGNLTQGAYRTQSEARSRYSVKSGWKEEYVEGVLRNPSEQSQGDWMMVVVKQTSHVYRHKTLLKCGAMANI